MSTEEKTNDMGKNQDPLGLLRRKGARYYGRFSIGGKTKFVALNHTRLEAAKIRFSEENQDARTLRRSRNCPNSTRTKIPPRTASPRHQEAKLGRTGALSRNRTGSPKRRPAGVSGRPLHVSTRHSMPRQQARPPGAPRRSGDSCSHEFEEVPRVRPSLKPMAIGCSYMCERERWRGQPPVRPSRHRSACTNSEAAYSAGAVLE
jgi:hypothetical protein